MEADSMPPIKIDTFTLPKALRLLKPSHFYFVFQHPKRAVTSYITILGRLNKIRRPRVGLTVAKKHIKQAHERNRIKRLIRESFRLHQNTLPAMDFIVVAKRGVSNLDNHTFTKVLATLWCRYRWQYSR